ncbi:MULTISPECIES: epoxide hydrolase family protein [Streptomyces]|uniref:Epoxide hydrolase n=1 Tax=Streptomyces longisporus TaxID=1948 RepID=A0ABN3N7U2_STRLO
MSAPFESMGEATGAVCVDGVCAVPRPDATPAGPEIVPFRVEITDDQVADLRDRLARTRWPDAETVDDWSQGVPLSYLREVCGYWQHDYDMQRVARRLNAVTQFVTTIDGLDIHFIHVRSPHANAVPLVLTHGWPTSVLDFVDLVGPLTDPVAHGADAADAFHVVIPSLPGYGFGSKPTGTGWGVERIADAWAELMTRLGYDRFVALGGDWGAAVSTQLAVRHGDRIAGVTLNFALPPRGDTGQPTADELAELERFGRLGAQGTGYAVQQSTRPQTLGYGLADSPAAQCAWIIEKFSAWSDADGGNPEAAFSRDVLLDNVMVYWLNATAVSSARLYWESFGTTFGAAAQDVAITAPTAYTAYPSDVYAPSERLARIRFANLRHYARAPRGGHMPSLEVPDLFLADVRAGVRAFELR